MEINENNIKQFIESACKWNPSDIMDDSNIVTQFVKGIDVSKIDIVELMDMRNNIHKMLSNV